MPILVHSQMHGTEATAANFLLDHILIYAVHGGTVLVAAPIMRAGIECFLDSFAT